MCGNPRDAMKTCVLGLPFGRYNVTIDVLYFICFLCDVKLEICLHKVSSQLFSFLNKCSFANAFGVEQKPC